MEQTWAPFYPIIPATPADYTNLPCTYRASESAPPLQGTFSLALPGFNYDGQNWVPVGGTRFSTFTILCSTPSPPPPPPRCGRCSWRPPVVIIRMRRQTLCKSWMLVRN